MDVFALGVKERWLREEHVVPRIGYKPMIRVLLERPLTAMASGKPVPHWLFAHALVVKDLTPTPNPWFKNRFEYGSLTDEHLKAMVPA